MLRTKIIKNIILFSWYNFHVSNNIVRIYFSVNIIEVYFDIHIEDET